jgi:guanine deaminase
VKEIEPWSSSYTDVYASYGLLTEKTILAHCVYLSEEEVATIKAAGAGIAHCPNSNCSLRSGNMDARRMQAAEVRVGMGTDCSGGYSPSVLENMRFAVNTSKQIFLASPADANYNAITFADAIYMATKGSALATRLDHKVGTLEEGLR